MTVGILGGGISGIALQRFLKRDSEVLEAAPVAGGLCRTYWKDGFGYDLGGHILFSKNAHVNQLVDELLGENINHCRRANQVLYKGRYVKYPFENDLGSLDKQDCYDCLMGFLNAQPVKAENFEQWMYGTFGAGITDRYLLPYNRKIWKTEPREMSVAWVERIPRPPVEDVIKSALGISTEGYTHQLHFRYPLHGGVEALVQALMRSDRPVRTHSPIHAIRRHGTCWSVSAGKEQYRYDEIVVAFPVHEAARCLESLPDDVSHALSKLRHNALYVVLIGLDNESLLDKSAVYIPDPDVLPHRICYMGYFSPNMTPKGKSCLIAEITVAPGSDLDRAGRDWVIEQTIDDLHRCQVIDRSHVITTDVQRIEYAYPVYHRDYDVNVRIVRDYFASIGVHLLGRFAEFDYINSDECLNRAWKLAERLDQ